MSGASSSDLAATGISGFDEILKGGFPRGHVYLIEGPPGAGKTTLAIQFALEGIRLGEKVLYITLSETKDDLMRTAAIRGWSLEEVEIEEVFARSSLGEGEVDTTMFSSSETELSDTSKQIAAAIGRFKPKRVIFDSLTEIRLQAQTALRYRREVIAIRRLISDRACTALFLDESSSEIVAESLVQGVIEMTRESPAYGPACSSSQASQRCLLGGLA